MAGKAGAGRKWGTFLAPRDMQENSEGRNVGQSPQQTICHTCGFHAGNMRLGECSKEHCSAAANSIPPMCHLCRAVIADFMLVWLPAPTYSAK